MSDLLQQIKAKAIDGFIHLSDLEKILEGMVVQVCKLGIHGKAYDLPETKRAYTYAEQPNNLDASKLGEAADRAMAASAGDRIDRGLLLLRELEAKGFGVFELASLPQPTLAPDGDGGAPTAGSARSAP